MKGTKKLVYMAILTTVALTIFVIEAQIPLPLPIPGLKLGLANIVTVFAVFTLGPLPALAVLLARILLGALLTGQAVSLLFSLCGGLVCFGASVLLHLVLTKKQIWVCGTLGAVAHNAGQLCAAWVLTGSAAVWAYMPVLTCFAVVTGTFTGFAAQLLVKRTDKLEK